MVEARRHTFLGKRVDTTCIGSVFLYFVFICNFYTTHLCSCGVRGFKRSPHPSACMCLAFPSRMGSYTATPRQGLSGLDWDLWSMLPGFAYSFHVLDISLQGMSVLLMRNSILLILYFPIILLYPTRHHDGLVPS